MDIDIDLIQGINPKELFPTATQASRIEAGELLKHNVGWYFQSIPKDPITDLSAIPYKDAEDYGFFKIDFLHINVYDKFDSKEEIRKFVNKEPNWDILLKESNYRNLFQISRHYETVMRIRPRSIAELSDCIAIVKPGARGLLDAYINANTEDRIKMRPLIYLKNDEKYTVKKSHAHAYAMAIVLQLHLIEEGREI